MLSDALFRPDTFFEERTPRPSPGSAFAVVLVVALLSTAIFGVIGWSLSQRMTGTTQIDNPNRPADVFCNDEFYQDNPVSDGCSQPKTKTVVVGDLLLKEFQKKVPLVFVGILVGWPLTAVGLHVTSALFDGEGSFSDTLAVAGWGMLPSLVQALVGLGLFYIALRHADLSGSNVELLADQLQSLIAKARGGTLLVSALGTFWQGVVWTYGLKHTRRLQTGEAAAAAGIVAVLLFVMGALG